jgi:MFS family permease
MSQNPGRNELIAVLLLSLVLALVSARPYAGGWNDGSRLAAVECLVDYGTLAIDRSIFVDPARVTGTVAGPYPPHDRSLMAGGTLDKVLVAGHYYSDKPMLPAVLMAAGYQLLQWTAGLEARTRPDRFVYAMTLMSSGLAYVVAVLSIHLLARRFFPEGRRALGVTLSFALGTAAFAYARQVNSHEGLLAVAAVLLVGLHALPHRIHGTSAPWGVLAGLGLLTGLGYGMDFAAGPLLLATVLPLVAFRCRTAGRKGWGLVAVFLLAALPFVGLHHFLNYHIGGTIRPVNTVAEYLAWPGSPFDPATATGHWHHRSIGRGCTYALELLFGKKGFLLHQPVLILALLGGIGVLLEKRARLQEAPEMLFALAWAGATWLVYAWGSNNYSGVCATIRWFVPLLAPGYYVLLVVLRHWPDRYREFAVLAAGGVVLSALMWWYGPWMPHMVPGYWFILGGTLLGWGVVAFRGRSAGRVGT